MTDKAQSTPDVITVTIREAMRLSSLSHVTLYQRINEKKLQSVKVGKRRLVLLSSLKAMLSPPEAAA